MKIIAIGRNYVDHIKELNNDVPDSPVIFNKPETAILKDNADFYLPGFSHDIHHELEIIVKISKIGKNIEEKFAHKYYDEIGLGIDFTARDLQSELKSKGLPWELAKGFDGSAPISKFIPKAGLDLQNLDFNLLLNDKTQQSGNTSLMIYSIDSIIAYVSKYFTLKVGDIIFTGTPKGVSKVNAGDRLEGFIGEHKLLDFYVK
ncbi:MAG: fumarylacetoacetate hydrolase family protein [Spirosomaceae bacterium]|nr:fumarylacetoacetate hydrolase family protein [Spirosomataceae bacterium]